MTLTKFGLKFGLKLSTSSAIILSLFMLNAAQAKRTNPLPPSAPNPASRLILRDAETNLPLPNTPYFYADKVSAPQNAPLMTNATGATHVRVPTKTKEDYVLVPADGQGAQVFLVQIQATIATPQGTPYVIFNPQNNQALCGKINRAGWSNAYFMNNTQSWYDDGILIPTQTGLSCSQARSQLIALLGHDSEAFAKAHQTIAQSFVMTPEQADSFAYQHATAIIEDKSVNIEQSAAQQIIEAEIDKARAQKNASHLNSLGYALGFERQQYKRGLGLLTESLAIKPNDCYATNSKGYLLMKSGKPKEALTYFYQSDAACKAAFNQATSPAEQTAAVYPIAANFAHMALNYDLLGDAYLANEFFGRALRLGVTKPIAEFTEVAQSLIKSKTLSPENQTLYADYLAILEREKAKETKDSNGDQTQESITAAQATKAAASKPPKKMRSPKP
jgi:tetratricopeptide (TPR) repeat protein